MTEIPYITKQLGARLAVGLLALVPWPTLASACDGLKAVDSSADCSGGALTTDVTVNVVNALFTVAGAVAVIIIIMGGIRYITSTGDSGRIKAAKDTILYAVIGLVVIIVAREIVGFVIGQFI
jgi:hypothetical protein